MRTCPRCKAEFPEDARFCPEDGTQLASPDADEDPHIGKVLLRQFEVREICGRGSMGTVYRAWQGSMERDVAVKILRRDLLRDERVVKRFHREALASARLSHPNIITVHLVGDTDDGLPFLVMEYVTGISLDQACVDAGPMPVVRAVHIAKQISTALTEAHTHNIVHRDLKPENILLSTKNNTPDYVKVLDFGIAKILYANAEPLTQTGAIFGTPHYLAPEQASGSDIDHRCDLYALGVILFRMLTGRLPFESESGMEVLIQHLREPPPRPRDLVASIPQPLEEVTLRCLAKDADDRFQSCEDLTAALNTVVEGLRSTSDYEVSDPEAPADDQADEQAEERAYPPTQQGAPAVDAPGDSDPRYRVPSDKTLGELSPTSPTESDIVDKEAVDNALAAALDTGEDARRPVGSTTVGLARGINKGRRRVLLHGLFALGSILCGSAVGAATFWAKGGRGTNHPAGKEPPIPKADPEPQPLGDLPDDQGTPEPDLPPAKGKPKKTKTKPKRASKKRASKKRAAKRARPRKKATPRPRKKKQPLKPVGATPTDHHAGEPAPVPPKPSPKIPPRKDPPPRKDDFYDLVD